MFLMMACLEQRVYNMVNETISHYLNNGNNAHVLLVLGVSKDSDMVNKCLLSKILIDNGIHPLVV